MRIHLMFNKKSLSAEKMQRGIFLLCENDFYFLLSNSIAF